MKQYNFGDDILRSPPSDTRNQHNKLQLTIVVSEGYLYSQLDTNVIRRTSLSVYASVDFDVVSDIGFNKDTNWIAHHLADCKGF
jgi:hypothetical protein